MCDESMQLVFSSHEYNCQKRKTLKLNSNKALHGALTCAVKQYMFKYFCNSPDYWSS